MSEPARNRFALDLEDLERQLRGAAQAPKPGHAADPLAELTRIVGQDDPLKDLFAPRGAMPAPVQVVTQAEPAWQQPMRQEANFSPVMPAAEPTAVAPPAEMRGALDEFEALLRRNDPERAVADLVAPAKVYDDHAGQDAGQGYDMPEAQPYSRTTSVQAPGDQPRDLDQEAGAYPYAYEQSDPRDGDPSMMGDEDMPDMEPRRSRKGLWTAAALMVVGVVGVGAAMTFRSPTVTKDGLPPVISADRAPTKVEPANPGGAEIPNQNKQIYEKVGQAQPAQTKVVTREEQPIDVQQAARTLPPRVVLPGPGSNGSSSTTETSNALAQAPAAPERTATPAEPLLTPVPAVPGLGEPRRVRTVSIRPDGTPAPPASAIGGSTPAPLVTGSAPARLATPPGGNAAPAAAAPATANTQRLRPATAPELPKVQERVVTPAPATTPQAPTRIAAAAPAPSTPAPATSAIRGGTGDFTVQLGAPGSEAEARATFSALQRKYPDLLNGQAPIVRKTDLAGGKTVYRLRVGPYSREDAATMCTQLQSAGGQCFIAKN